MERKYTTISFKFNSMYLHPHSLNPRHAYSALLTPPLLGCSDLLTSYHYAFPDCARKMLESCSLKCQRVTKKYQSLNWRTLKNRLFRLINRRCLVLTDLFDDKNRD